jgi:hypothetical protein
MLRTFADCAIRSGARVVGATDRIDAKSAAPSLIRLGEWIVACFLGLSFLLPLSSRAQCMGDCDGAGGTSINYLVLSLGIALGRPSGRSLWPGNGLVGCRSSRHLAQWAEQHPARRSRRPVSGCRRAVKGARDLRCAAPQGYGSRGLIRQSFEEVRYAVAT